MQAAVLDKKEASAKKELVETAFSFRPFVNYLKKRVDAEKTIKSEFYRFVLNKFKLYPHLENDCLTVKEAEKYNDVLELVYTILSPAIEDETKFYWALGTPSVSQIVYGTDAFFSFLDEHNATGDKKREKDGFAIFKNKRVDFIYRLILQKLYGFPSDISSDIICSHADPKTKVCKYYSVHTDTSFIDITSKGELPDINPEMIEPFLYDGADMEVLQDIIPLSMFRLEGFAVITIEDITAERAVENIRSSLAAPTSSQYELYAEVINSLQTLSGNAGIKFGLLPFLRVNGRLIFNTVECSASLLIKSAKEVDEVTETLTAFMDTYVEDPGALYFSTLSEKKIDQYPFLKAIKEGGIKSYAILPVFYNRKLAGILEIFSEQKVVFYEKLLSRLQIALPLLAQLLQDSSEQFNQRLDEVIKANFTTLQKPVEWKFNEAAWRYLIAQSADAEKQDIETVTFENVYPLFGAVDIRDSTIKHNEALDVDMDVIIKELSKVVRQIKKALSKGEQVKLDTSHKGWLRLFKTFRKSNDDTMFSSTLHSMYRHLSQYSKKYPGIEALLSDFAKTIDEKKGDGYANRRALEASVKQINSSLNRYFEKAQLKLQKIYPCYFEKFRSDGVEYDIYTGQAFEPAAEFTAKHLKQFRIWQVSSMIDIALLADNLRSKMAIPLQVASLIFIHSSQINICFRNDERRFDVEGYYNIRYEVIKKRIDKARIKSNGERLTQPGKISLVYFNDAEAEDYLNYIKELQKDKKLLKDLEFVELEELQGVTGLKAFRVSINIPNDSRR